MAKLRIEGHTDTDPIRKSSWESNRDLSIARAMAGRVTVAEVEELVAALATMTGESKTEAVRRALAERRERLSLQSARRRRGSGFLRYLEEEVWPKAPPDQLGRRLSREEEDEILGFGPEGM